MNKRYALFLVAFLTTSYSVATYGQVLHDPHVIHDTLNYGSGGGGSSGGNVNNANYATNAGNANTANYSTSSGSASSAAQCANSNTASQCANSNTASQAANANYATLCGTASSTSGNAATATQCGNANTATTSASSNNSNTTYYVLSGGNVNTGPLTATTGQFSGPLTSGTHTVNGNETITGTLGVTGTSTLGALIATTINATSAALTGALNAASATISGALSAAGLTSSTTLNVSGASTLGVLSAGASTFTSATDTGPLSVTGVSTLGVLSAGASTFTSATDTGPLTVSGVSTLGVLSAGASTFAGSTINGNETVSGTTSANAVNANNMTLATGGVINFPFGSKVTDTSNGVLQIQNSTGTGYNQSLLLGAATAAGGVKAILAGNNTLYFQTGDGSNNTNIIGRTYYASYGGYSSTQAMFQTAQGSGWGMGASDSNHVAFIANGVTFATGDNVQNLTISHALETPTVYSYSAAQTLTAAQCGAQVLSTGSTAFTVILPTTPPTGCPFVFTNLATATLTVQGNAANTATITGSSLTSGTQRTLGTSASSINTFEVLWNGSGWNIIRLVGTVQ